MAGVGELAFFAGTQVFTAMMESNSAVQGEIDRQQGICDSIDATNKELAAYEAISSAEATNIASMLVTQQEVIKQAQETADAGIMIDVQNAAFYVRTAISIIVQMITLFIVFLIL